jgi:hypothetical protein
MPVEEIGATWQTERNNHADSLLEARILPGAIVPAETHVLQMSALRN